MGTEKPLVLGLVPARGGSKGVLRKNLKPLAGRPLIEWTILAARASKSLDRMIVSTDDPEIAATARACGAEVPFTRPEELAGDDVPDLPVFRHALDWLASNEGWRPDILVHLRPTHPLRSLEDIDRVVALLLETGADSVKSVRPVTEHPHKMWRLEENRLEPYLRTELRLRVGPDYPRQQLEQVYVSSGLVDAVRVEVLEAGSTTGSDVRAYVTDQSRSVDLDSELDFELAGLLAHLLPEPAIGEERA